MREWRKNSIKKTIGEKNEENRDRKEVKVKRLGIIRKTQVEKRKRK